MIKFLNFKLDKFYFLLFFALPILWLMWRIVITVNDDAFVYFNYAKNFVIGNFFAYDPRGIPSEGFTSLIYLLLLVPFQALGIPMPFAAFLINTVSLCLGGYFVSKLFSNIFINQRKFSGLAGGIFLAFCVTDNHFRGLIGWGFETIITLPFFLAFLLNLVRAIKDDSSRNQLKMLVAFFMLSLVRPENLVICSPFLIFAYFFSSDKKVFIFSLGWMILIGCVFIFGKYLLFNDLFPTGFYRKMSAPESGHKIMGVFTPYAQDYFKYYSVRFFSLFLICLAAFISFSDKSISNRLKVYVLICVFCTLTLILLFISRVNPLVGYHFRYFILFSTLVYLTGTFSLTVLANKYVVIHKATLVVFFIFLTPFVFFKRIRTNPFKIYHDSLQSINEHFYVRLGKHFQKTITNPREIKLVFGDAGAIPYYFDCQFIDINGLTEPLLARAFNKKDRANIVTSYITGLKPDLVVLASHSEISADPTLSHGPLNTPEQLRTLLSGLRNQDFFYVGSINSYYDLHFGVRKSSTRFKDIVSSLDSYIRQGNGYFLPTDLTIPFSSGNLVFPKHPKS